MIPEKIREAMRNLDNAKEVLSAYTKQTGRDTKDWTDAISALLEDIEEAFWEEAA